MFKVVRFLELMWLVIAIISFTIASYHLFVSTLQDALFFYFMSGMAVILFFIRKRQRKRMEN